VLPSKASGKPVKVGQPEPKPPRKIVHVEKTCKLVSASVTCSHGRQAAGGVLCVVPDTYGSIGDKITGTAVVEGACGEHVEWSIAGMWTSTEHGASTHMLAKAFKPALLDGWLGLHNISPQTYEIQPLACSGDAPRVEVRAYPPDKWGGKLDFDAFRKKIKEWLEYAPVDDETKEGLEKGWFLGSLEYSQQWKEDAASNKVFCESVVAGAFDPLFGFKLPPVPIYPLTLVPPGMQKWLKAGVYFAMDGGISFRVEWFWNYFPETQESHYEKHEVALFGRITGELSVNLFLVSDKVVNAMVKGSTGLKAGGKFVGEKTPAVELAALWTGLEAAVSIKMAWDWIEVNRVYPIFGERHLAKYRYPPAAEGGGHSSE
jgi:hypothetical protein